MRKWKGYSRVSASDGLSAFSTTKPKYPFWMQQREVWSQGDGQWEKSQLQNSGKAGNFKGVSGMFYRFVSPLDCNENIH